MNPTATGARVALVSAFLLAAAPAPAATVDVLLWFDTEDYLLPADDDATLRLARWLTAEKVRATFKIVGEKARVLERRGRRDVVAALKKHEIGYHSDLHSVHPTPAAYMSALGWDEGVAEFVRREGQGVADLRRIFGVVPTCYGQPGSSWGPQSHAALQKLGMGIYLDSTNHVDVDGKPFYYGGVLTMIRLRHTLRTKLGAPADLEAAQDQFRAARDRLRAEGGGLVSVYYHPNEFVHAEFWDGVNFREGANPPRAEWKVPATMSAEQSRIAWANFEGYVRFMKSFPDVRFITAAEAARLYADRARGRTFSRAELREIAAAAAAAPGVGWQVRGDHTLAASEVLALLVQAFRGRPAVLSSTPFGPSEPPRPFAGPLTTTASQLERTTDDVAGYLAHHGRVPSTVWLGSAPVPPEAYLGALAEAVLARLDGRALPAEIEIRPRALEAARHVADDDPRRLWGWVIFPRDFRAPEMMALAKRQAWTLKPALRGGAGVGRRS